MPLIAPHDVEAVYPVSPLQEGMLFHTLRNPGEGFYIQQVTYELGGDLDRSVFERAWRHVVERHAALRTAFLWEGLERMVQVAVRHVDVPIDYRDWSDLPPTAREERLNTFLREDRARGFTVTEAPLMRLSLLRTDTASHLFVWTFHHALLDGWSTMLIAKEVSTLYQSAHLGRTPELPKPRPYREYIAWLQQRDRTASAAFWTRTLAGIRTPTPLPFADRHRGSAVYNRQEHLSRLSRSATLALQDVAARCCVTVATVVQAAWALTMATYSGEDDVLFGGVVSGRPPELPGVESMVGMFINTIPIRIRMPWHEALLPWLQGIQRQQIEARMYAFESLVDVQGWSEIPRSEPLFTCVLNFENYAEDAFEHAYGDSQLSGGASALQVDTIGGTSALTYPLGLLVAPGEELLLRAVYDPDCFSREGIEGLVEEFGAVLRGVSAGPQTRMGEWPGRERAEVEAWGRGSGADAVGPEDLVVARVAAHAAAQPAKLAVVDEAEAVEYGTLWRRSRWLGAELRALGVGPEVRVAVCLEGSVAWAVAVLGVWAAGGAYVALDPTLPGARLAQLVEDAGAAVIVTSPASRASGVWPAWLPIVEVGPASWGVADAADLAAAPAVWSPAQLAYVIYTSGSTGRPKGVGVEHRQLAAYVRAIAAVVQPPAGAAWGVVSSVAWDLGYTAVYGGWWTGGTVHMLGRTRASSAASWQRYGETVGLDYVKVTPSHLAAVGGGAGVVPRRGLVLGGEASQWAAVAQWQAQVPTCQVWNHYGPTECTVGAVAWALPAAVGRTGAVPLGRPLPHVQLYVMDGRGALAPRGAVGELWIGGAGVSRGYVTDVAATAARFVPDPFGDVAGGRLYRTGDRVRWRGEGTLEFLGRRDGQVKIRGHRIELGEIEAVLGRAPGVQQCAVVAQARPPGELQLVAYVVARGAGTSGATLQAWLRTHLPDVMVPRHIVLLDQLPLTPNGKLHRAALPPPAMPEVFTNAHVDETPTEQVLCQIWQDVLGAPRVLANQNFFDLGGHSLSATQVVVRIREAFGVDLPVRAIFDWPKVSDLAKEITQSTCVEEKTIPPIVHVPRGDALPLSFGQQRLWFVRQMEPGTAAYTVPYAVKLTGALDVHAVQTVFIELVRRHEALRTCVAMIDDAPVQRILPAAPFLLDVVDLSALDEADGVARAHAVVEREARTPFDLSRAPLLRASLVRLRPGVHVLIVALDHIVCDGWSIRLLLREFAALYCAARERGAVVPLPELTLQYADYAVWQRERLQGETRDALLNFWRTVLAGAADLPFPVDRSWPDAPSHTVGTEPFSLDANLSGRLEELAHREHATMFMAILAALAVVVGHASERDDMVIGTSVAGRAHLQAEPLIGFFVNQLALRVSLIGIGRFRDLLTSVRRTVLDADAHQELPFEQVVEALAPPRRPGRHPIFDVKLVVQRDDTETLDLPELQIEPFGSCDPAERCLLFVNLTHAKDGVRGAISYLRDLLDRSTVAGLAEKLRAVVHLVAEDANLELTVLHRELSVLDGRRAKEARQGADAARSNQWGRLRRSARAAGNGVSAPAGAALPPEEAVTIRTFGAGRSLPIVVEPKRVGIDLPEWLAHYRPFVQEKLERHGAILLRGFEVARVEQFHAIVTSVSGELLRYDEPTSPRTEVSDRIYTSTDYPSDQVIQPHNERSYSLTIPRKLYFWCETPAQSGGETPLGDSRNIYRGIDSLVRDRFAQIGWMYVRNFSEELGLPWQRVFGTTDRAVVDAYCATAGIEREWKPGGRLCTRQVRPAVATHPETGEPVWFNHILFFHVSSLHEATRRSMLAQGGYEELPNNTYYGDGAPIEDEVITHIRDVYAREMTAFAWQRGDVLLVDNMLVCHARASFEGPRKILVAMAEPYVRRDVVTPHFTSP